MIEWYVEIYYMWKAKSRRHKRVVISFSPEYLCMSWVSYVNDAMPLLTGYRKIPCTQLELLNGKIYNQTVILRYISQFLTQYSLYDAPVSIWISGSEIRERLVKTTTAHPSATFFDTNIRMHMVDWDYLYPIERDAFIFYVAEMPKALLLQYQVLAMAIGIHIATITTYYHALVHLYKCIHGTTFRHSAFADQLQQKDNNIIHLFDSESVARTLAIHPGLSIDITKEYIWLLGIAGIYMMEKTSEKN
jgi:hypothetical protein